MSKFKAVLFDLDGTLLDTLPDFLTALNLLRKEHQLDVITAEKIRPFVNAGSRAMLMRSFNIDETHPDFETKRERVIELYSQNIAEFTKLFHQMDEVLRHIENNNLPWGIVTNKPAKLTHQLLTHFDDALRPHTVISGDTLDKAKPHPEPVMHACSQINVKPDECLFIGDAITDVQASKAAGSTALVALYGYIDPAINPKDWQAHGYINKPIEIIEWL